MNTFFSLVLSERCWKIEMADFPILLKFLTGKTGSDAARFVDFFLLKLEK